MIDVHSADRDQVDPVSPVDVLGEGELKPGLFEFRVPEPAVFDLQFAEHPDPFVGLGAEEQDGPMLVKFGVGVLTIHVFGLEVPAQGDGVGEPVQHAVVGFAVLGRDGRGQQDPHQSDQQNREQGANVHGASSQLITGCKIMDSIQVRVRQKHPTGNDGQTTSFDRAVTSNRLRPVPGRFQRPCFIGILREKEPGNSKTSSPSPPVQGGMVSRPFRKRPFDGMLPFIGKNCLIR